MSAGFGRLVLGGAIADDPYVEGLDDVASFEVISDDGPRYRIDRQPPEDPAWGGPTWVLTRVDPMPREAVGSVGRRGFRPAGYQYFSSAGDQAMLINAIFAFIGELEAHGREGEHPQRP